MNKFRNENEIRNAIEKDFPVPDRLSPDNLEAILGGDSNCGKEVYAKGPHLWTIGAVAAAFAIIAGTMFFFGKGGSDIEVAPSETTAEESIVSQPDDSEEIPPSYEEATQSGLSISAEGYEPLDEFGNMISVTDLEKTKSLTVNMEFGNSDYEYLPGDVITGVKYYIFFNGYSALDLTDEQAYEMGYVQFINEMGSGEFVKTDEGYKAQYTFDFSDYNEISLKEKTFNVVVVVIADDYQLTAPEYTEHLVRYRVMFNTAYDEQNKISYLEEIYPDTNTSIHGTSKFDHNYDNLLRKKYYYDPDDPEYSKYKCAGAGVIEDWDNGKLYVTFNNFPKANPTYLFEDAYYIFTFIDDKNGYPTLTPLEVDGELIYQPLVNCRDCDGKKRFFCAEVGDLKDITGVEVLIVSASPHFSDYGAIIGKNIGHDRNDNEAIFPYYE